MFPLLKIFKRIFPLLKIFKMGNMIFPHSPIPQFPVAPFKDSRHPPEYEILEKSRSPQKQIAI
jgi:hypothetical protein